MAADRAIRFVTICNPQGLHMRPADMLARQAGQYTADIFILKDGDRFDVKSILSLITLRAEQGTQLQLSAVGPDAEQALDALGALFARGFDEMDEQQPANDPKAEC